MLEAQELCHFEGCCGTGGAVPLALEVVSLYSRATRADEEGDYRIAVPWSGVRIFVGERNLVWQHNGTHRLSSARWLKCWERSYWFLSARARGLHWEPPFIRRMMPLD